MRTVSWVVSGVFFGYASNHMDIAYVSFLMSFLGGFFVISVFDAFKGD